MVNKLGEFYDNYIPLNLEKQSDAKYFKNYGDEVKTIINAIILDKNLNIKHGQTLMFIDEIQEVPEAISLLRYFYEEKVGVDIIAAGSLLEFALGDIPSFPVGRVEQVYLYPLDFEEFLLATNEHMALDVLRTIPIPEFGHEKLMHLFHEYVMIGGMPEIVAEYIINDKNVSALPKFYASIWENYKSDIEKYGGSQSEKRILNHIMSVAHSIRDRVTFNGFGASSYGSREVSEAFRKLQMAGILTLVYPTLDLKPPIIPNLRRKPKLQLLDTGLLNYAGNLHKELLSITDLNNLYKGFLINHIVFQEIISQNLYVNQPPYFWVRENPTANAEIDVVIPWKQLLIPVELKSGAKGSLKSLQEFMERCDHKYAFRLLGNKYSKERCLTKSGKEYLLVNLPYYTIPRIHEWIAFIINEDRNNSL